MADSEIDPMQIREEIHQLKARLAELEDQLEQTESPQRPQRSELSTSIRFIGDFGLLEAKGIDLSDGGICFEVEGEIPFDLEFEHDGKTQQHRAHIVWMHRLPDGRSRFGFQFLSGAPSGLLWLYKELGDAPLEDE